MGRFIGVDIGATHVRAVLLVTSYKRVSIEQMQEVAIDAAASLESAIQIAAGPMLNHADGVAAAVDGDKSFVHRLSLPSTALKQLEEILPFELEALVPVDIAELVYDYRLLPRRTGEDQVQVLTALSRTEHVRSRIELIRSALGREPDKVGCGPVTLANLSGLIPELRAPGPVALVDLGGLRTEITLLLAGEPAYVRTLSRGVHGLPEAAPALSAELRQTFLAFLAVHPEEVASVVLIGGGAAAEGAADYLAHELGIPVRPLPALEIEPMSAEYSAAVPRFAKAIALATGLTGKGKDVDLRRGPLAFQRGYGFLKEKAPVLAGLVAAVVISFFFSTWAELRALDREHESLTQSLAALSKEALGEEVTDPEQVTEALNKAKSRDDIDPMPKLDAFDVIVEISNAIPSTMTHDIDEFDMQRGHVKIYGVVGSAADAQQIATKMGEHRCVSDEKISKISQQVNSERQKYVLEFDVKCPDEAKKKPTSAQNSGEQKQ